jgi:hypothetical protein
LEFTELIYNNRKFPDYWWLYLVVLAFKYIAVPFILIWCINTLFRLENPITFWTWLASLLFLLIVKFMTSGFKFSEPSYSCSECSQRDECEYSSYDEEEDEKDEDKYRGKIPILVLPEREWNDDLKPNNPNRRKKKRRN